MKDSVIEACALLAIVLGLLLGYFLVFDYAPADAFFLEEADSNAFLSGEVLGFNETKDGTTMIKIESCRAFTAYYDGRIDSLEDNVTLYGSFSGGVLFVENYK
jgi:hypothetical protein